MKCTRILLFSTLALAAPAWGHSPPLVFDFSPVQHKPGDHDVDVQLLVRDPQATDYNRRYNGSVTVKPGRNTIDLDYTQLPRYATQNSEKPDHLDARQITLIVFFLDQPAGGTPMTLFFDNVRLSREATGKVEVRRS